MKRPMLAFNREPISARTHVCAVLGHPIAHSASPAMHNAAMLALGLDWRYLACDVRPEELAEAIRGARAMGWVGLNLTVPHKSLAVPLVDQLDDSAREWGAVNTIRFETRVGSDPWVPMGTTSEPPKGEVRVAGFNTDANAITRSLREDLGFEVPGHSVLLLGAGGAGRTAALKLAEEGVAELHLVNRTLARAECVKGEIESRHEGVKVNVGYPSGAVDLVLNATSLGLDPRDPLPLDTDRFSLSRAPMVYDMIYRPVETPLIHAAIEAGCRTANGLGMLLYQGAAALELWSGLEPPIAVMRQALHAEVYGPESALAAPTSDW